MFVELLHENPVENLLTLCKDVFIIVCLSDWAGPVFWLPPAYLAVVRAGVEQM